MKKNLAQIQTPRIGHADPDIAKLPIAEALDRLGTSRAGLSSSEALLRIQRHGKNSISAPKSSSFLGLIKENFLHTMAILLWTAGLVGFAAQMPELGTAIWLVNLINGTFSFWQEYQAEKATEALSRLLPEYVQTIRDGECKQICNTDLVPGDIICLSEGDKIPADARLIEAEALRVDQSTLSGESSAKRKNADTFDAAHTNGSNYSRADISNLVFAGTSVLTGHGQALVFATGTSTEFGRIAHLTQTLTGQPSPLQKEMQRVTKSVTVLALSVGAVLFILATMLTDTNPAQAFIFTLGMIVAFVPEGMVPTVTLALAMAVQRMAKHHALVKRLSSVEALGCTNVICTDKTGTLTKNEMTVLKALAASVDYTFSGRGYDSGGIVRDSAGNESSSKELLELLRAAVLCNNAKITLTEHGIKHSGDPTELALLVAARKAGVFRDEQEAQFPRLEEIPFDSYRKCMSTIHSSGEERILYLKGSPANVLDRCTSILESSDEAPIGAERRQALKAQIDSYAAQALRVIAVARRELKTTESLTDGAKLEKELCFLGLLALFDPPRPEVPDAVNRCHSAGIQIVMITGDYEKTAEAIARNVGIIHSSSARVITGQQLDRISESELIELLSDEVVFARVNPEHKLRVVTAFQRCSKIVAVTGDGVNDAPALKQADIGVAMGLAGTDVAREAADMILLDDNFASIVSAVEEGRQVYENIKKFAVYVFNSNMAEAVPFAVMLFSCGLIPLPLTIMQVLSIDLGTDMVPAIGLGVDRTHEGIMEKRPRSLKDPLLSRELLVRALLWYGIIESIAGLSGYFFCNFLQGWPSVPLAPMGTDGWRAATSMTLSCIVASQIGTVFCCRTEKRSLASINAFDNRMILLGIAVELLLLSMLIYLPALQRIFNTASLGLLELCFAFAWTPIVIILDELRKFIVRRLEQKKEQIIL